MKKYLLRVVMIIMIIATFLDVRENKCIDETNGYFADPVLMSYLRKVLKFVKYIQLILRVSLKSSPSGELLQHAPAWINPEKLCVLVAPHIY
ncbi:hypothetical protein JIN85_20030 [Luteolibacter pohnpeiensis]|uniref:Uncharacterized protein n=1 Tax=Luteolibacter pohnpeiensis TaxID=454153 RepID=A0A934S8H3_9BACT|nr:hypothetical protein [Luteolibacter pohnpeiensis]MBK1884711.1 hypothetical protein [Luteolibacter pohnpeiensis]